MDKKKTPKNQNKGKKFDKLSLQWLPTKQWKALQDARKVITKQKYLASKPYAKWTKADKAFSTKHPTTDLRATAKKVARTESKGLKAKGFIRESANTAKSIILLQGKYPEIKKLSVDAQRRFEYSTELIKHASKRKGFKEVIRILIEKAINKESGIEKGKWLTGDDVKYVNDHLEDWDIPESQYSAVYGSDVI